MISIVNDVRPNFPLDGSLVGDGKLLFVLEPQELITEEHFDNVGLVLIDWNVRRKKCNIDHLTTLEQKLKIKKNATSSEVIKQLKTIGIEITPKKSKKSKPRLRKQRHKKKEVKELKKEKKKEVKKKPKEKKK